MFARGKKGISSVVTTVLFILIVVAAIAVISILIINLVGNLSKGTDSSAVCQKLEATPIECVYNSTDTYSRFSIDSDGTNLVNITMVYEKETGSPLFKTIIGSDLENLTTTSFLFNDSNNISAPKTFSILPLISINNVLYTCPQSRKINCVLPVPGSSLDDPKNIPATTNTNPGFVVNPSNPGTAIRGGGGGGGNNNGPSPTGNTSLNGVCGNTKYTCSVGTVSAKTHNNSDYLWSCVGTGTGSTAGCKSSLSASGQTFNLTQTCTIYTYSNQAGCSGVNINGSAYCWSTDYLTAWGNISAGINLTASYLTIRNVNGQAIYLDGNWLQQMPAQVGEGPFTPGIAYVGVLSLDCLLGLSEPSNSISLTPPENIDAYLDYVECSSICYNHSYAGFIPDHRQHDIRIYPYKIVNGIKYFSDSYSSYSDIYGTNLIEDTQYDNYNYNIHWTWSAVAGADGYRILKWDTAEGRVFDHYYDTAVNSFYDGDYSMSWTYGNAVTPTVNQIGNGVATPYNYTLQQVVIPSLNRSGIIRTGVVSINAYSSVQQPITLNVGSLPTGVVLTSSNYKSCTPVSGPNPNIGSCSLSFDMFATTSSVAGTYSINLVASTPNTVNKTIPLTVFITN